jgi:tRNA threonylcarbamoyl adenosine modification protein (Sua5/YciO/YrdC/YwlC family)
MKQPITDDEAIVLILKGGVGIMPTDTIYGLVCRADDPEAVKKLYALKHRDHKPGTVVAGSVQQLRDLGVEDHWLERVHDLWPNPLSIETPMPEKLSYLHQDTGRQGLRVTADERMQRILAQTGPLATSSANQPGEPASETLEQAQGYFHDDVDFYVDGGDLSGRAPSTIARITDSGDIEIIRQGAVTIDGAKPASY